VALDALPAVVREALQKRAGAGKVTKVESITMHGNIVAYEAQILIGTRKYEAQVGPGGKPLDHGE
jgi:hypothetical protein